MDKLSQMILAALLIMASLVAFVMIVPDPDPDDQQGAEIQCRQDREKVNRALATYASKHNADYPKTLRQLVPDQLDEVPWCRMAHSPLDYQPVKRSYELSCQHHGDGRFDK